MSPRTSKIMSQTTKPDSKGNLHHAFAEMAQEADLPQFEVEDIIERSLLAAYRQYVNDDPQIRTRLNNDGSYILFRRNGPNEEILPAPNDTVIREAARMIRTNLEEHKLMKESDHVSEIILSKKGEMYDSVLEGNDENTWVVRTKDFLALLPPHEQIPGEKLRTREHIRVIVVGARQYGGAVIGIVSRSHPMLVRRVLEEEVPEIASGQIVIDAVSREAGRRSKVAVHAIDAAIDAQGACIGPKGVRHRSAVQQLGGEHIHIVTWHPEAATFIANALAPATATSVTLDEDMHTATITVDAGQLSLAIGKGGENARLVAKLTGWKIDIHADTETTTAVEPQAAHGDVL